MLLDPSSPVPLYSQIRQRILEMAANKAPGERLFTDSELVALFGVNRMTVRQAVQELVREGYLYRVRGVGTFRAPPKVSSQVDMIERFWQEWGMQGRQLRVEITAYGLEPCPPAWAARLQVQPETPVLHIGRLRHVDGIPFTVDHRYVPARLQPFITEEDVVSRPLWVALASKAGLQIGHARNEIQAVPASVEEAALLKVAAGFPLLMRRLVINAAGQGPVVVGSSAYRGDLFVYTVDIPEGSASQTGAAHSDDVPMD